MFPSSDKHLWATPTLHKRLLKNRLDITADPGGHRPQHPCAQGRTRAKQDQAQASAPWQNRTCQHDRFKIFTCVCGGQTAVTPPEFRGAKSGTHLLRPEHHNN